MFSPKKAFQVINLTAIKGECSQTQGGIFFSEDLPVARQPCDTCLLADLFAFPLLLTDCFPAKRSSRELPRGCAGQRCLAASGA